MPSMSTTMLFRSLNLQTSCLDSWCCFFSWLCFSLGPCFICLNGQAAPEGEIHQREKRRGGMCNNKWGWGHQLGGGKEGREAFMYDGWEVERVANCQVLPLSLLFVFDTQSQGRLLCGRAKERRWRATIEWNRKGVVGGMLSQTNPAECFRHLCSSLMRPWGTLCRWIEMRHRPKPQSRVTEHSSLSCSCPYAFPFFSSSFIFNFVSKPKHIFIFFFNSSSSPSSTLVPFPVLKECHWSPLQTCWLIRRWIEM